jgi:hypothetical protein
MMEALKHLCFAPYHPSPLSHPASGDSTVEVAVHRKAAQVVPAEELQRDEADRTGMVEKLQLDPVVPASVDWDSQAAADHPDPPGKAVSVQKDLGPDRSRA